MHGGWIGGSSRRMRGMKHKEEVHTYVGRYMGVVPSREKGRAEGGRVDYEGQSESESDVRGCCCCCCCCCRRM